MTIRNIQAVIFDLGGVLIDWNPNYLYRKIFGGDQAKIDWFLAEICPTEWNEKQDAGRSLALATEERVAVHPEWENEIRAFYERWSEMVGGLVPGTGDIMRELRAAGVPLYALSNWSAETFPLVRARFDELDLFEKIFVSGEHGCAKPDERYYHIALDGIGLPVEHLVFIDDNQRNIAAAEKLGLTSLVFSDAKALRRDLRAMGFAIGE